MPGDCVSTIGFTDDEQMLEDLENPMSVVSKLRTTMPGDCVSTIGFTDDGQMRELLEKPGVQASFSHPA